ncbi:M20/M25/M40 family metallo-hydrolase [Streptomyces dysideae]|uniref:M20/M25/M40 family metallo-hydrolase n=1 Tax=Streptomyces dysideae TaxID=909626 RepID=UPI001F26EC04|nr:M20/M25/M40 family metallo-hydrolase [Streptomyces dysideae]
MSKPVDSAVSAVRPYDEAHRAAFLDDLAEWLRIPSVSAQPDHAPDVRRSADWLAAKLTETGFPTTEVWETPGGPGVYSGLLAEGAEESGLPYVRALDERHVGHFITDAVIASDGMWSEDTVPWAVGGGEPAHWRAPNGSWEHWSSAFASRAATRIASVVRAGRAESLTTRPCECGQGRWGGPEPSRWWSRGPARRPRARRPRSHSDATLANPKCRKPASRPSHDRAETTQCLLSSELAPRPVGRPCMRALTDRERELFAELPFDELQWLRTAKSHATHGEAGHTTRERQPKPPNRPTAEVNGIGGGYQGPGSKTIIPSSAMVKLSFRMVAGQDPGHIERAVRAWTEEQVPAGIRCEITFGAATRPCLTPLDHPALQAVARAMSRALGRPVRFTREGGSGPAADLQEVLGAPLPFLGISVPSDGRHAPNEQVELDLLLKGVETTVHRWGDLAANWRHAP